MKLSIRVAAVSLTPVALTGSATLYTIERTSHSLVDSAGEELQVRARALRDVIQLTIEDYINQWRDYLRNPTTRELVRTQLATRGGAGDIDTHIRRMDALWLENAPDAQLLYERLSTNTLSNDLLSRTTFYHDVNGHRVFPEAFITDDRGANIALTNRTSDYWQADERWWQRAWKNGLHVGHVEYDESADVFAVPVALRFDDDEGRPEGVLKFLLDIARVFEMVDHHSRLSFDGEQTRTILLSETGQVLHYTIPDRYDEKQTQRVFTLDWKLIQEQGAAVVPNEEGVETLTAVGDWPVNHEGWTLPWVIVMEQPASLALAGAIAVRRQAMAAMGAAVFLAIVFASMFSLNIVERVKRLREAAEALGAGNLKTRVDEKGSDELASLARSFNAMADELSAAGLEQGLARRKLEARNKALPPESSVSSEAA